jgi:3-oxoacyl-[acyl-carrier protein] reductase
MEMEKGRKIGLVTGASRGLGKRLALGLSLSGYHVATHFRSGEKEIEGVAREIRERGRDALPVQADLSIAQEIDRMVKEVIARWGKIDLLINNAAELHDGPLVSMSVDDWDAVVQTGLSAPFRLIRQVARGMEELGGGQIVNIGLIALTRAAARELGPAGIRVNAVSPGFMETDMTAALPQKVRDRAREESCLGRYCDPDDVVRFVRMLIDLQGVTGQLFCLDSRIV